jgi:hypothetical protein
MYLFAEDIVCDEVKTDGSSSGVIAMSNENDEIMDNMDEIGVGRMGIGMGGRRLSEPDEEWSTPLAKISRLVFDHESWMNAREILEVPSAACRKVGDEARSLAARHVIDRIREKDYLDKIQKVAPRLRSAVELLSKPDADYVYPPFRFVVNQLRKKHPEIYTSVVQNVGLRIPHDMKPTTMLVSMAKYVIEDPRGETMMDWGKFTAILGLCGALAIDSVEADYSEGVAEVVDTFGLIVEQVMGEWILSEECGGGWEGFIRENHYDPILSPIPRTLIILTLGLLVVILIARFTYNVWALITYVPPDPDKFWKKWGLAYPSKYCSVELTGPGTIGGYSYAINSVCERPTNPLEFLYSVYVNS